MHKSSSVEPGPRYPTLELRKGSGCRGTRPGSIGAGWFTIGPIRLRSASLDSEILSIIWMDMESQIRRYTNLGMNCGCRKRSNARGQHIKRQKVRGQESWTGSLAQKEDRPRTVRARTSQKLHCEDPAVLEIHSL